MIKLAVGEGDYIRNRRMDSATPADLLCDHYHLKNQWLRAGAKDGQIWYSHRFSPQQGELVLREGVGMRQLDIYSAREVYSFPFCPRLYRYSTTQNTCLENDLSSSLHLFLQRVPNRLTPNTPLSPTAKKLLRNRLEDLVSAFHYLHVRFGPFQPNLDLIGWTDLKVVKVWIHPDYSCNTVKQPLPSEQLMVKSLVQLLLTTGLSKHYNLNNSTTFQQILTALSAVPARNTPRQVAFEVDPPPKRQHYSPLERQSPSEHEIVRRSRKNITFSYSNIGTQHEIYSFKSICANIRNRHRVDPNPAPLVISADLGKSKSTGHAKHLHFQGKRVVNRMSVGSDELTLSHHSHISLERTNFKPTITDKPLQARVDEQQNKQNMSLQPKQQHFNQTCEGFNRQTEEKPRKNVKNGLKQLLSLQVNYLFDDSLQTDPTAHFQSPHPLLSPRSQVQDDLDALFHSNKQVVHFDSNALERELDGILF